MSTQSILRWVAWVTANLRPSQSRTLALLVAAAIPTERPNLATLGRDLAGPITAQRASTRAWRFTGNARGAVADGRAEVINQVVPTRRKRWLVSFDWTEVRSFHTLMTAAGIGGRAVPRLGASYPEWQLLPSPNSLEEGLLQLLRRLIPDSVQGVILADRGFGRAAGAAVGQELNCRAIVRIKPAVTGAGARYRGVLSHSPVPQRFDRFLLILALAYIRLVGWGCRRGWTSSRRPGAPTGARKSGAHLPSAGRCSTGPTTCQTTCCE